MKDMVNKMDIQSAKKSVIEAGKILLSTGLIARTWGNISCRLDDAQFVITPSGRAYDSLTPDDIVTVGISDASYEGDVKPSSERGIHAACYRMRPDVNFVIHTHQTNASVMSVLSMDLIVKSSEFVNLLGDSVPLAKYGLPGTKKLCKGVCEAIERGKSDAIIMAHHGALCMGGDFSTAFQTALTLERASEEHFKGAAADYAGDTASSERTPDGFTMLTDKPLDGSRETQIHGVIYGARPDVNYIIHSADGYAVKCSAGKKPMKPMLDDFAQLLGRNVKIAKDRDRDIAKKTKGRNAVFVRNSGAYCYASAKSDAEAAEMIMRKGCKTQVEASLLGNPKTISAVESALMRLIYLKKYSKKI